MGSAFPDINLPELTGVGGLEIVDLQPVGAPETSDADTTNADTSDATASAVDAAVDTAEATDEFAATTEAATADIQLAQADVRTDLDASPAPAAVQAPKIERPASNEASAESTMAGESPEPAAHSAAPAEIAGGFSSRLLVWILGGAVLAAAVILSSSYWMRSRQGV
jgi:hypothetical protein